MIRSVRRVWKAISDIAAGANPPGQKITSLAYSLGYLLTSSPVRALFRRESRLCLRLKNYRLGRRFFLPKARTCAILRGSHSATHHPFNTLLARTGIPCKS